MTSVLGRANSRSKVCADHKTELHTHTQRHHVSLYGKTGAVSVWFAEALVVGFEVGLPQSAYFSIRQHTRCVRQHTTCIRQHTQAMPSIRLTEALAVGVESVFHSSKHLKVYRSKHFKVYLYYHSKHLKVVAVTRECLSMWGSPYPCSPHRTVL